MKLTIFHTTMNVDLHLTHFALRKYIGYLGASLPFVLVLGNIIFRQLDETPPIALVQPSISDYYYTEMGNLFIGVLWAIGLFLFSYRGHPIEKGDFMDENKLTNFAGILAILVSILPVRYDSGLVYYLHMASASSFFMIMGLMSYFRFPRGNQNDLSSVGKKKRRRRNYKAMAIVIWISLFVMSISILTGNEMTGNNILYLETICLLAFGTSWIIKGRSLSKFGY